MGAPSRLHSRRLSRLNLRPHRAQARGRVGRRMRSTVCPAGQVPTQRPVIRGERADTRRRPVEPRRRASAAQTASWPWAAPTRAWAISCRTVSRTSSGEYSSMRARDRVIRRRVWSVWPARRLARSRPRSQSPTPLAAMRSCARSMTAGMSMVGRVTGATGAAGGRRMGMLTGCATTGVRRGPPAPPSRTRRPAGRFRRDGKHIYRSCHEDAGRPKVWRHGIRWCGRVAPMSHRPGPRSPRPPSAGRSRPRASARRRTASPTARSGGVRTGGSRTGGSRTGGVRTGAPRSGRRPPGPFAASPAGRRPAPRRPILLNPVVVTLVSFVVTVLVCFIVASRMGGGGQADARVVWTEMGPAPVVLDTEGFDPAHLIDDDVFYDSTTMTPAEIAAFIARVNAGCRPGPDGTPCLAEATFTSVDREPTDMCPGGYRRAPPRSSRRSPPPATSTRRSCSCSSRRNRGS